MASIGAFIKLFSQPTTPAEFVDRPPTYLEQINLRALAEAERRKQDEQGPSFRTVDPMADFDESQRVGAFNALQNIPNSPLGGAVALIPGAYEGLSRPVEGANPEVPNMLAAVDQMSLGGLVDTPVAAGLLRTKSAGGPLEMRAPGARVRSVAEEAGAARGQRATIEDLMAAQPRREGVTLQQLMDETRPPLETGQFIWRPEDIALNRNRYRAVYGEADADVRNRGGKPIEYAVQPKAEVMRLEREGKPYYVGRINPEQWLEKQQAWVGPEGSKEWNEARGWYKSLLSEFTQVYGAEHAPAMLSLWGLSQQRASPSAGMSNVLKAQDIVAGWRSELDGKAGLAHDRLMEALTTGSPKVGEKLADFADAVRGRTTRQWTGHDPRTGQPAPFDVHASRDLGFIDDTTRSMLTEHFGPEVAAQVAVDMKQAPSDGQYAYGSKFYNTVKDVLNARLEPGQPKYTADEVQAIGWVGHQLMTGASPEGPGNIFQSEAGGRSVANISRVAVEAAPGEGSPLLPAWEAIPEAKRAEATYRILNEHAGAIADTVGVKLRRAESTVGVWQQYSNPNVTFEVVGTPDGALRFAQGMAYAAGQSEVWAHQSVIRDRANAFAMDIKAPESFDLTKPAEVTRFWNESGLAQVPGLGAAKIQARDGDHRIRVIFDRDPGLSDAARQDGRDFDTLASAAKLALEASPLEGWSYRAVPLGLRKSVHDWKGDASGQGHLRGLDRKPGAIGELDGIARRVAESFRREGAGQAGAESDAGVAAVPDSAQGLTLRQLIGQAPPPGGEPPPLPDEGPEQGPTFYSQARRVISDPKTQATQTGEAWLKFLQDPKRGVKSEELQYTGLGSFLKSKGGQRVTREEIQGHLDANEIEIKEVTKGYSSSKVNRARARLDELENERYALETGDVWDRTPEQRQRFGEIDAEAERLGGMVEEHEERPGSTKFSQHTLPGAENYREVLLTIPSKGPKEEFRAFVERNAPTYAADILRDPASESYRNWEQQYRDGGIAGGGQPAYGGDFTSGHWDEPNVLAHLRLSDRTDGDGKRMLLVEEIQSDWAQKGRKEGFRKGDAQPVPLEAKRGASGAWDIVRSDTGERLGRQLADTAEEAIANYTELRDPDYITGLVPTAPFVTDTGKWTALSLKRVLKMAADEGYDRIGIVPGVEQAKRYDLSKQISKVSYDPTNGYLDAWDLDGKKVMSSTGIKPDALSDQIGKEVADRLLASTPAPSGSSYGDPVHTLSGLDLQVGGEGMKGYYDKIVPDILNKLAKEYGVKVNLEGGKVKPNPVKGADFWIDKTTDGTFAIYDSADDTGPPIAEGFKTKDEAEKHMQTLDLDSVPIHTLDIPEPMKKNIKAKGFPLYSSLQGKTLGDLANA